jgi:class 3 adenylate cyclase/CHASE2 domain-containing sensor protein
MRTLSAHISRWLAHRILQVSPLVVGFFLVACAVGTTSCSALLDRRVREAQMRESDAKGMELARAERETAAIRLNESEDLQRLDILQRLEWALFDWRVRLALGSDPTPSQVGLVLAGDESVERLSVGEPLPYTDEKYDLFWPRWPVYGRVLRELRAQGAAAVAFDVLFLDRRYSDDALTLVHRRDDQLVTNRVPSDQAFGAELRKPGSPVIAAMLPGSLPAALFHSAVRELGDVASPRDSDSVARRIRVASKMRWVNPAIGVYGHQRGVNCEVNSDNGTVKISGSPDFGPDVVLSPDDEGFVSLPLRRGLTRKVKVWEEKFVWHLGITLAAQVLDLNLDSAEWDAQGVRLRGNQGGQRYIPIDSFGYLVVDWRLPFGDTNLFKSMDIADLVRIDQEREFEGIVPPSFWTNAAVVLGSTASGNNLTDLGATPLKKSDYLVTTHMNVADMILRDRYVHRLGATLETLVVAVMGAFAAVMTWKLRGWILPLSILGFAGAWIAISVWAYQSSRWWIPVAHPVFAGLLIPYLGMVTTRAFVEQREQLRVRRFFEKMVSPEIVEEVLKTRELARVGAGTRRRLTVFFADVRGFTEMTDRYQAAAENHVRELRLDDAAAELYYEQQASEVLATVNLYLATIADVIKFHRGTLDKYIGDCVMAFWGAPLANPRHAVDAVMAGIDAQWAIQYLNEARIAESKRREQQNPDRISAGLAPLPPLPVLNLGSGLNTGDVTVGFMGSEAHIRNYTVFGREVNLASRLEGASGHARILVGEATYEDLKKFAPDLAAMCNALPPVTVKGFRQPVLVYEVPWLESRQVAMKYSALHSAPSSDKAAAGGPPSVSA